MRHSNLCSTGFRTSTSRGFRSLLRRYVVARRYIQQNTGRGGGGQDHHRTGTGHCISSTRVSESSSQLPSSSVDVSSPPTVLLVEITAGLQKYRVHPKGRKAAWRMPVQWQTAPVGPSPVLYEQNGSSPVFRPAVQTVVSFLSLPW